MAHFLYVLNTYIFCTLESISYRSLKRALNICDRDHHNLDITTELKALVDVSGSKAQIFNPLTVKSMSKGMLQTWFKHLLEFLELSTAGQ